MKIQAFIPGVLVLGCLTVAGCATANHCAGLKSAKESQSQELSAMSRVVEAMSGREMHEKDLQKLNDQIQKDPKTKSAVEVMAREMSGQGAIIKYCPIDGQRFSARFMICPEHHVQLKILND